jgi:hypothetical protein
VVAQELGQPDHGLLHWSRVISKGAVKGLARVRVRQTKRRKRMGRVAGCNRRGVSSRSRTQGNSSIYSEFLISVNLLQQQ